MLWYMVAAAVATLLGRLCFIYAVTNNPFAQDARRKRSPYITDQKKRAEVIKQHFHVEKVPPKIDAIVIGSGAGGLSTAALLAKAGKKVLVLEQHDQAGGGLHTFVEKGYEFDVGVHYVGEMGSGLFRTLFDQLTDGQLEWAQLDDAYDVMSIGYGKDKRQYPVASGHEKWKALMKKQFPGEDEAIETFFKMLSACEVGMAVISVLKALPLWLSWLLTQTGLVNLVTSVFGRKYKRSTLELVSELTENRDLRSLFCYNWGDHGLETSKAPFIAQAMVHNHFAKQGGWYPVGGSSEFAYNMVPIIERYGGKVLVRANVEEILYDGRKVTGVKVRKGMTDMVYDILAPVVVSSVGIRNTFKRLLPEEVASKSYFGKIPDEVGPSFPTACAFLGFDATTEELELPSGNIWAFSKDDCGECIRSEFMDLERGKALQAKTLPMAFVASPSAKDPHWRAHPERESKSALTVITGASYDWFGQFEGTTLHRRGDKYEEIKARLGDAMVELACDLFPRIRHHIDYAEFSTPLTNNFYLGQRFGETYGLEHNMKRFTDPWFAAKLRPKTDVPGLFLAGQDLISVGVMSSFAASVMTASAVLGRNLWIDLAALHFKIYLKGDKKG